MIFINAWNASGESYHEMVLNTFAKKSRKSPLLISSENFHEDVLKKWLCLIESRESDCVVINNGSGLFQSGSIECNGIETDIVVQVHSVCESGECENSTLNPVVSTRAKAKLVITKFYTPECQKCGYNRSLSIEVPETSENLQTPRPVEDPFLNFHFLGQRCLAFFNMPLKKPFFLLNAYCFKHEIKTTN